MKDQYVPSITRTELGKRGGKLVLTFTADEIIEIGDPPIVTISMGLKGDFADPRRICIQCDKSLNVQRRRLLEL